MPKRFYTIRLYKIHDMDLLSLESRNFSLVRAVYCALKAFANDEVFMISPPGKIIGPVDLKGRRWIHRQLKLDEEKDADMIRILDKFKDGARNNFLKNILRIYLNRPYSSCFLNNEEDEAWFEEKLKIFGRGHFVDAGHLGLAKTKTASKEEEQTDPARNKKAPHLPVPAATTKDPGRVRTKATTAAKTVSLERDVPDENTGKKEVDDRKGRKEEEMRGMPVSARQEARPDNGTEDDITDMFVSMLG